MTLAAGTLNRQITIQQRTKVQDAAGQEADAWSDVVSCWSYILGQTGLSTIRSRLEANVETSIQAYSFRIRYRENITSAMRVMYRGMPFNITEVRMDLAGREWTDLVCAQGGNDG